MDVQKFVDHLVWVAKLDKAYAWWAAKEYASRCEMLRDLPKLLTEAMREANLRDGAGPSQ